MRARKHLLWAACVLPAASAWADIKNWQTGETIPGTETITPQRFSNLSARTLSYADLRGLDLYSVNFSNSKLDNAAFDGASLWWTNLSYTTLDNARFTDAIINGVNFWASTGFTKDQFYSTASYKNHDLHSISMTRYDISGWDLSGQNLFEATLEQAVVTNTNFTDATVAGTNFLACQISKEQLYSTASYKSRNLRGIQLGLRSLKDWNLSGQDLTGANLYYGVFDNTNLTDAIVTGADFSYTTNLGFTKEMLYSTGSYKAGNLGSINLGNDDVSGWDFSGQNMSGATFPAWKITGCNFSNADLRGAKGFSSTSTGLVLHDTIFPDGSSSGLTLAAGERRVLRNQGAISTGPLSMDEGATLVLGVSYQYWSSTITVGSAQWPGHWCWTWR